MILDSSFFIDFVSCVCTLSLYTMQLAISVSYLDLILHPVPIR